jgi:very-short-patch-repair endonuclease
MTRKAPMADMENAIQDYLAGDSIETTARKYHTSDLRLTAILRDRALFRDRVTSYRLRTPKIATAISRRFDPYSPEIIRRYIAGESELSIANNLALSRNVVARRLATAYIPRRNGSEANRLRFRDYRQRGIATRQAHLSMGRGETEFCSMLEARGYNPIRQLVVGRYNLDLVIPSVAVEVHWRSDHPFRRLFDRERVKYITNLGWHMIFVWVDASHPLTENAAENVVAFAQIAQRNPPGIGNYRVIRGTGEIVAEGCGNIN